MLTFTSSICTQRLRRLSLGVLVLATVSGCGTPTVPAIPPSLAPVNTLAAFTVTPLPIPAVTETLSPSSTPQPNTPTRTSTPTGTAAPSTRIPTPTPSIGSISGQVIVEPVGNPAHPAANAQVYILDKPDISATTNNNGDYVLRNVPNGQYRVFARTSDGTSDLLEVNVQGSTHKLDILLRTATPFQQVMLVAGRVQDANGGRVSGAIVWVPGKPMRTVSDPDGSFHLVYVGDNVLDKKRTIVAAAGNRWGYVRDEGTGSPTIPLNRRPPVPLPPVVVYDFIEQAASAEWRNGGKALVWNLRDTDQRGAALWRQGIELEDGSKPARVLETRPQQVNGGSISGIYKNVPVLQNGDWFIGRVGLLKGANAGRAVFLGTFVQEGSALSIIQTVFPSIDHSYTGALAPILSGIQSGIVGRRGRITLQVDGGTLAQQDFAVWVQAQIVRPR